MFTAEVRKDPMITARVRKETNLVALENVSLVHLLLCAGDAGKHLVGYDQERR